MRRNTVRSLTSIGSTNFVGAVITIIMVSAMYKSVKHSYLNYALRAAIQQNETSRVVVLLQQGADPNEEVPRRLSRWKARNFASYLFRRRGQDLSDTPLMTALRPTEQGIANPDPALIFALLQAGANANSKIPIHTSSVPVTHVCYETPLLFAVMAGRYRISRMLIQHGADVNVPTQQPPLARAIGNKDNATAYLLLNAGADVNARDINGGTPLMYAAGVNNDAMVKLLLAKHAETSILIR